MKTAFCLLAMLTSSAFAASSVHEFSLTSIDGAPAPLSAYKGRVVLIVNVASQCGYTKQYEALQELYAKHEKDGLVVIGVPSNEFGMQEPGTEEEIKKFCTTTYKVTFPMYSKITVKGEGKAPLYRFLTGSGGGEVKWNFTKFLVDGNGKLISRFESAVEPDSPELIGAVEKALQK